LRFERSKVVLGILVSLAIILTIVLAAAVYNTPSSRSPAINISSVPYFYLSSHDIDNASNGPLLGAGSSLGSSQDPIRGSWKDVYGDIYTFAGSMCMVNFDFDNAISYYTHQEKVWSPSNTPYTVTVYSIAGDPEEGFAFLNGDLHLAVRANTRWEFWYVLTPTDPILGRWKNIDDRTGYMFVFDGTHYTGYELSWPPDFRPTYNYKKLDNVLVRKYLESGTMTGAYQDYYITLYRTDCDSYSGDVTLMGYGFIDGKLYDIRSDRRHTGTPYVTASWLECVRC